MSPPIRKDTAQPAANRRRSSLNDDPLSFLDAIMSRCGARCSPAEFHAAVNVTFHGYESEIYDEIHRDMWVSLPPVFELFAHDCLRSGDVFPEISMLDIGCGTGLASDSLFRSALGPRIRSVDLLDTSPKMLERAARRATTWRVPFRTIEGALDVLAASSRYDLVVACSVLHHIPDLPRFLGAVARLQLPGGFFIHLQDPNAGADADPELRARASMAARTPPPEWIARFAPRRIAGRLWRELTGRQSQDYISRTNRQLLEQGVIRKALAVEELFAITDVHVHDEQGVSVSRMKSWMPAYELVSQRAYGFFGALRSSLAPKLQAEEDRLLAAGCRSGSHIGAAWRRV